MNIRNDKNFGKLKYCLCILFGLVLAGFSACAKSHRAVDPDSAVIPNTIYEPRRPNTAEGAIWPGDNSKNLFFEDTKARKVGDVVTVLIQESATSSQSATTATDKASNIDMQANSFLGVPSNWGIQNFLGFGNQFDPRVNAALERSTTGEGTTTRAGTLTGTITAMITEVLPGGNFRIEGKRSVTVNNEEQYMILRGIIRPVDINFTNTISSVLIAEASITYSGEGVIADEQRVGWATRILTLIWPF